MALGGSDLVVTFVDDVLNRQDLGVIQEIFSPDFCDFDPLIVPGVIEPAQPRRGSIEDIQKFVGVLAQPGVDIRFALEEIFEGGPDRIAYRLFGEGLLSVDQAVQHQELGPVRRLGVGGTDVWFRTREGGGTVVADSIHVSYQCVGIFRAREGRLQMRWGRARIE